MRRKFIGGNWKMHGTQTELTKLTKNIIEASIDFSNMDVVLFPSFVYLTHIYQLLSHSQVALGAQNLSEYKKGAYTGEISATMLKDIGCRYVIVGHSERRHLYGENNALVAKKFKTTIQHDLIPVLCIGETQLEREMGKTESVILEQLNAVIDHVGIKAFAKAIIAYLKNQ